jgi:UDP-glucose 4-epimerase
MDMNWLITGGCGFIGSCLIDNLMEEGGHFIRVVDNLSVGTREDLVNVCEYVELDPKAQQIQTPDHFVQLIVGDIRDDKLALKASEGIDVIVHLAASTGVAPSVDNPRSDCLDNVIGTLNYLEAARLNRVKRFIFASSGATIGDCKPPIHEKLFQQPVSPYGASKLSGEAYCSAYCRTFGIETVILRFGNVYGPRSSHKDSVVPRFIKRAMDGKFLEIYGDGEQTRDFIFSEDLIGAIRLAAATAGIGGETFQIATSSETTIAEIANKLRSILDKAGIENIEIKHRSPRKGDVFRNFSDTTKAKKLLGWQAQVNLAEGLQRVVDWFIIATTDKRIS